MSLTWFVVLCGVGSVVIPATFFASTHFAKKIQQRWVRKEFQSLPPEISVSELSRRWTRCSRQILYWLVIQTVAILGMMLGIVWLVSTIGHSLPLWQQTILGYLVGLPVLLFITGMNPAVFYGAVNRYYHDSLHFMPVGSNQPGFFHIFLTPPKEMKADPIRIRVTEKQPHMTLY